MSSPDALANAPQSPVRAEGAGTAWGAWRRPALLLAAGLTVGDGVRHVLHLDGGTLLGFGALAGGWWLLGRRRTPLAPRLPRSLPGWIERCEGLLDQFERLEGQEAPAAPRRRRELSELLPSGTEEGLALALVSSRPPASALAPRFRDALRTPHGLRLAWGHPLPSRSESWRWPVAFERADVVLHHLSLPLRASDLRWLEALPEDQPVWLLVERQAPGAEAGALADELTSQWPAGDPQRILEWDGGAETIAEALAPLAGWLSREGARLRASTPLRCLRSLHGRWQAELEALRRREWRRLQQRTQWLVAGGVLASPLPSVDLLVLAAANGLMLREMARLWDCPWTLEQLRAAAVELGRASLALGVVEWSTQALGAAARLHVTTWLVGGTLQALSAAYLTRVVGHAMADMLALSAGVSEPDLEAIRRQAPMLVARAAEAERLDWGAFLAQGGRWARERSLPALQGSS